MKLKPLTLDVLVRRIINREPFMLARYGDGEWLGVLGRTPKPRWGPDEHEPDLPGLPEALQEALRNHPVGDGVYLCQVATHITEKMGIQGEVEAWIRENAPHTVGRWWSGRGPFRDAAMQGKLGMLEDALRSVRTCVVGGPHLKGVARDMGAEYVGIPAKNCWREYDATFERLSMTRWGRGDVITFSAAMMSEVIIPALWEELGGEVTLMDVGSIWDVRGGKPSRSWHGAYMRRLEEGMKSRAIIDLCLPRSGSTTVAGVQSKLGVPMGRDIGADALNPRGYYEDARWHRIHNAVTGYEYNIKVPRGLAERHYMAYKKLVAGLNGKPVWGVKDPRTCLVFPHIVGLLQDPRVVVVKRGWEDMVRSLVRHSEKAYGGRLRMTYEQAEAKLQEWQAAMDWSLDNWDGPLLEVWYEELMGDTEGVVREMADFIYEGLPASATEEQVEAACRWVDPNLRHFGETVEEPGEPDEFDEPDEPDEPDELDEPVEPDEAEGEPRRDGEGEEG